MKKQRGICIGLALALLLCRQAYGGENGVYYREQWENDDYLADLSYFDYSGD